MPFRLVQRSHADRAPTSLSCLGSKQSTSPGARPPWNVARTVLYRAVFCGSLGGGGGAGAGGAGAGGAGAGGAGGAGGAAGTTSASSAGGAAGTTSASSAGGAGGGSAGTTSASSSASGSNSGNYSGGSGSGTSKLGAFVFVAVAGLMIYLMYMDDKCRRTPGCKPDQTLPTTNAVDWSGDKILTAWNTGPNWP
jgi:hypothetical protein